MGNPSPSPVVVEVPARPEHVHALRAVVASVAARASMPYDIIEDLKIAVNEACAQVLESSNGSVLRLTISAWPGGLEIRAATDDTEVVWPPEGFESSLTWHVLTALTDDASFERDGGTVLRFTKRALEAEGG